MSIADQLALIPPQIDRLKAAKAAIVAVITAKGVSVPESVLLDALDAYVALIQTGADVSGVTTAAADVLAGKKFVDANGVLRDGTMPSKVAATYTPGTSNQTIAAGQYLAGTQTIKGDANLVAANIKKGISIFGVVGSAITAGIESVVTGQQSTGKNTNQFVISGLSFSKVKYVVISAVTVDTTSYNIASISLHNGEGLAWTYGLNGGCYSEVGNSADVFTYSSGVLMVTSNGGTFYKNTPYHYVVIGE